MSLTELITRHPARAEVRARLNAFLLPFRGSTHTPLLVPSRSRHPAIVGTAFDYAARIELQYRAPHAIAGPWIAEHAVKLLRRTQRAKAQGIIRAARRTCASLPDRTRARFAAIAELSARLAPLDLVFRAGRSPFADDSPPLDHASIASEVAALLEVATPLWSLAEERPLLLNPEVRGDLVGGADADIVAGSTLVELKTTKDPVVQRDHLRQLVGYACLAAAAPRASFPRIDTLAVYFPRFGLMRTFPLGARRDDLAETALTLGELWRGAARAGGARGSVRGTS